MKAIVSFAIFLYSAFANATTDTNFGRKIEFHKVDGKPRFGVQIFEDRMAIALTVNGFDLAQRKTVVTVNAQLTNKATGETLAEIIRLATFPNGVVLAGTQAFRFTIEGSAVAKAIDGLATFAVVLSTIDDGGARDTSYIDLELLAKLTLEKTITDYTTGESHQGLVCANAPLFSDLEFPESM